MSFSIRLLRVCSPSPSNSCFSRRGGARSMVVENKSATNLRNTWIIAVFFGMIGLVIGAVGGYLGHIFGIESLLVHFADKSHDSPFERTYGGMARFAVAETSAANCDGAADLPRIVENERRLIDLLELSATGARLTPPLNVARAIVAYRSAKIANLHNDKQAFDSAVEQEKAFLQAAGWTDTSHDHFASVIRDLDGCPSGDVVGEKGKQ
jgi:hypothetical protein